MTSRDPKICHVCKGEGLVWKRVGIPPRDEYYRCAACNGNGVYPTPENEIDPTFPNTVWPDEETDTFPSEPDPTA